MLRSRSVSDWDRDVADLDVLFAVKGVKFAQTVKFAVKRSLSHSKSRTLGVPFRGAEMYVRSPSGCLSVAGGSRGCLKGIQPPTHMAWVGAQPWGKLIQAAHGS